MSKYNKIIAKQIFDLFREDSYTIAEVCRSVGIAECTYYDWVNKKPEFSENIKKAKDDFNELIVVEARRSLIKLVKGYTVKEERVVILHRKRKGEDEDYEQEGTVKERTVTDKHFQPNPASVFFTLTNRDPDNWKNKMDNNVTGDITLKSELDKLSDEELERIIQNGDKQNDQNSGSEKA